MLWSRSGSCGVEDYATMKNEMASWRLYKYSRSNIAHRYNKNISICGIACDVDFMLIRATQKNRKCKLCQRIIDNRTRVEARS